MMEYFGCSRWKVEQTMRQMEYVIYIYIFSGAVIDRDFKKKFKPFTSRRILRMDYFTKPVLEQDSEDNVLAPLSLTHFETFDKLSRYSVVKSVYTFKIQFQKLFSRLDGDFLYMAEWTSIPVSSFTWNYLTTTKQKQSSLISGKEWKQIRVLFLSQSVIWFVIYNVKTL